MVSPACSTVRSVRANAASSSAGKPTITSLVRLNSRGQRLEASQERGDGVAAAHRVEDAVVAALQRHVEVPARDRRLAQRGDERVAHVVDLDRAEPEPGEPGDLPRLADEARQVVARLAVAEAAEVDPGQHDLAVALRDAAADLAEHGVGAAAARRAAHERDHAEVARERAAVLDLHEGAHAVEPGVGLDAADRADVAGDERGRVLAAAGDDRDVRGEARRTPRPQIGRAACQVDAAVRARGPGGRLAALGDRLVRDAAGADHGDVCVRAGAGRARAVLVAVGKQPLADLLDVRMGDLAAEKVDA